ncbi:MAG: hypothetical protein ACYTDU_06940, partial [Planctomycetota bacterium]
MVKLRTPIPRPSGIRFCRRGLEGWRCGGLRGGATVRLWPFLKAMVHPKDLPIRTKVLIVGLLPMTVSLVLAC